MPTTDTTDLAKGSRVVVTSDLPGVPEGTGGKLGDAVGLTLIRYRVDFDNGESLTSVAHTRLVAEKDWEDFQAERTAAAERAQEAEAAPAPVEEAAADGDGGGGATDDRLAALLARSKAAKEKKLAAGG